MRYIQILALMLTAAFFASCSKGSTDDNATITVNGRLYAKSPTATYTYGTDVVAVDLYNTYVVESTSLDLASYVGDSVQVVLKDMGIRQNPGPELYNVITITPLK